MNEDDLYRPINCEYHDLIEALATRRADTVVVFLDEAGAPCKVVDAVADIGAQAGEEFMTLRRSGRRIRLDRIVSIDGIPQAGFGD